MIDFKCYIEDHQEESDAVDCIGYIDVGRGVRKLVENWDCGDYIVAGGEEVVVIVIFEDGRRAKYKVSAEQDIIYSADLITEASDDETD